MFLANMIWPSLYLANRLTAWWAIVLGLIIEFLFLLKFFKLDAKQALIVDAGMNAWSCLVGIVLIPLSGLVWEVTFGQIINALFNVGTFNPMTWVFSILLAALTNATVEIVIFKQCPYKVKIGMQGFLILVIANVFSVAAAFLSLYISPLKVQVC